MTSKLPPDAFQHYLGLGPERSYKVVADHYGVSKRAVTNRAVAEKWQERVDRIEHEVQRRSDAKAVETLEQMGLRHLKMLRLVQGKALEALKATSLGTAMDAVRALDLAIKQERLVRGEPGERTAVAVEDVVKREYERWMKRSSDDSEENTPTEPRSLSSPNDSNHQPENDDGSTD